MHECCKELNSLFSRGRKGLKCVFVSSHLDELQFDVLGHLVGLADPEDVPDDVLRRVAQRPQLLHHLVGLVDVPVHAVSQHAFHQQGMGLVTHFEDVLTVDVAEAGVGGLQVVQSLERPTGSQHEESCCETLDCLIY